MKRLFRAKEEVRGGVHPSEDFADGHLWENASNVYSSERSVRPINGQFPFIANIESLPVRGMLEVSHAPTPTADSDPEELKSLFWGSENSLFLYQQGLGVEDVTPAGGFPAPITLDRTDLWDFTEHRGVILAVIDAGSVNNPMIYVYDLRDSGGSGVGSGLNFVPFSTHPNTVTNIPVASARIAKQLNQFTLLLNCKLAGEFGKESNLVVWHDIANIWDWAPTTANLAGALRITEMDGPIVAAENFGNALAVYSRNEMFVINYANAPLVFVANKALSGIGALSKNSIAAVGRTHYGIGPKGIWQTDGFSFRYVDRPDMYNYIYQDINLDYQDLVVAWHNSFEKLIVFFYPSGSSVENDKAVAYNYTEGTWWPMGYNRTAAVSGDVFNQAILADSQGNIYQQANPVDPGDIGTTPGIPGGTGQPLQMAETTYSKIRFDSLGFGQGRFR